MNDITKKSIEGAINARKHELEEMEEYIYRTEKQLERHKEGKEKLLTEIKALEQDLNK